MTSLQTLIRRILVVNQCVTARQGARFGRLGGSNCHRSLFGRVGGIVQTSARPSVDVRRVERRLSMLG